METDFEKMWSIKYAWTGLIESVLIAYGILIVSLISMGIAYLITFPMNLNPENWYYCNMFLAFIICILILFGIGNLALGFILDLSEFSFFAFKSKKWKQKWYSLNH